MVTRYLYDGLNIIAEMDVNNNITKTYTHNLAIDDPLAMTTNGQTYYYHKDGLGSITAITDSSGVVVQKYEYDSFGNIVSVLNPNFIQPYTFTGREFDWESGLYYLRARELDSKTGTFTQKDPIGFNAGDTNLYRYVKNRPTRFVDPLGLEYAELYAGYGAIAGAAYVAAGSVAVDAVTLGANILATPAEIAGGALIGSAVGYGIGSLIDNMISPPQGSICHSKFDQNLQKAPGMPNWSNPSDYGSSNFDPNDWWKKPSNWDKMSKWQKIKWHIGKAMGAWGSNI